MHYNNQAHELALVDAPKTLAGQVTRQEWFLKNAMPRAESLMSLC